MIESIVDMKRLSITFILILGVIFSGVSKERFLYKQISQKDGLTSKVNSIYKEANGNVWLGTPNGLYTFNGHELKQHNDTLFLDKNIRRIEEDREGNIWILTDNWLMRRSKGEERFIYLTAETHRKETIFYSTCHDEEGIWFGSYGSIYRYTFKDKVFTRFCQPEGMEHYTCLYLNKINDSTLFCGSNIGSYFINTETGIFTPATFGPSKEVSCTMTDSKGRIWIAFYNHGIRVYEKDGTLLKSYSTRNSSLSNDIVICFTEKDSKIWAGTDGGGINIIDPETDDIEILSHVSGDPYSFPAHSIMTLYTDNYGNIWAGTTREGLIRISQSRMMTYSDSYLGLSSGLSNKTILSLFQEDGEDAIWVGTDCEGINKFDPKTGRFTHFDKTFKTKIVAMATYSETELAVSVYADGIWLLNKKTGAFRPMTINNEELKYALKYTGRRAIIANGKDNDIYILRQVVQKYDKKTGECNIIPVQAGEKTRGHMYAIGKSEKGLYIHDTNGIYRIDEEAGVLLKLGLVDDDVINSGYLGVDGDIWLATRKGLCRFNENSGKLSYIDTNLFSEAYAVVWDGKSRVWIGTDSNLFAYLTDEEGFTMFGESDGAALNEYIAKPRLLSHEGDVYMGGVQGLLAIDSDFTIDASEVPVISLYEISADRNRVYADNDGIYEVPRNSKLLSISVSTHETDIFRHKMYRFSLSGSGKEYEQMSPSLEIKEIPKPGKYDILVSCTKRNGDWTDPTRIMTIMIPKPWYLSGWFIAGAVCLILLIAGIVTVVLMNRKANRLQLALKEQEQKIYEEKVQFLINISHELRTPLTLIMAPLKRLLNGMDSENEHQQTLSRIYRQSRRMRDLLNMVLDLRKMEVGKNSLRIENTDFNEWILNASEDIINEEHAEDIEIVSRLDPAVGTADFDKTKCDSVLTNMLMNAIKHSSTGDTIIISTELTEEGMVRTSISDEGPGLRDIEPEKMFTRFYQSNSEQYGSGIGLSYSKILVELHGGRIGAYNNPDCGATFWWEIPVHSVLESNVAPSKAYLNELIGRNTCDDVTLPDSTAFKTTDMKIMLVDDNQDLLDFLKEAMTAEFAEIYTATGGNNALSLLHSGKNPDIIVSDVNMPDGDGYTFCRQLKEDQKYSHIPVVLLTARGEEQSQSDSYKAGADAYMAKPFETETLVELARNLLRRKEEIRHRYLDTDGDAAGSYGAEEESFIIRLNSVISANISNPELDQKLLCRELGVSRALLYNKMKAITGAGTKEYITRIRIDKAKSLMENSSMTIAEISDSTGFASQSYFSTAFKNATGMTPSRYKHEHSR